MFIFLPPVVFCSLYFFPFDAFANFAGRLFPVLGDKRREVTQILKTDTLRNVVHALLCLPKQIIGIVEPFLIVYGDNAGTKEFSGTVLQLRNANVKNGRLFSLV